MHSRHCIFRLKIENSADGGSRCGSIYQKEECEMDRNATEVTWPSWATRDRVNTMELGPSFGPMGLLSESCKRPLTRYTYSRELVSRFLRLYQHREIRNAEALLGQTKTGANEVIGMNKRSTIEATITKKLSYLWPQDGACEKQN